MENRDIIEKAAVTLNTLATGGLMNPTQFNTFYRKIIDAPTILNSARTVQMPHDTMKIEKIGFGQRVLRPGVEGQWLKDSDRAVPTTSTIELHAREVIAEVNITYDTLENNIEGDNLYATIMSMLAERVALDTEELVVLGDTASADPYLRLIDGIMKRANKHTVDFTGKAFDKGIFKALINAVPAKYRRNPAEWMHYLSYAGELEWKDSLAGRQTALGDSALQGGLATAYGIPLKGIAMLQERDGGAGTQVSDSLFTHPKNLIVGISRNVRVEVDRDIRGRKFIIVLTMKLDTQIEEDDAVAKGINIKTLG